VRLFSTFFEGLRCLRRYLSITLGRVKPGNKDISYENNCSLSVESSPRIIPSL
jgi:hypothetical protein